MELTKIGLGKIRASFTNTNEEEIFRIATWKVIEISLGTTNYISGNLKLY